MRRLRGFRRRDVATWVVAFAASCVVGAGEAHAAKWTTATLIMHATPSAAACKVSAHWGPKQIECASFLVFRREPRLGREAFKITRCETGGTLDENAGRRGGTYKGLGQFHPRTWKRLPRWLSKHSPYDPPWVYRAMRYLRQTDGDWHQWPACSRRL